MLVRTIWLFLGLFLGFILNNTVNGAENPRNCWVPAQLIAQYLMAEDKTFILAMQCSQIGETTEENCNDALKKQANQAELLLKHLEKHILACQNVQVEEKPQFSPPEVGFGTIRYGQAYKNPAIVGNERY